MSEGHPRTTSKVSIIVPLHNLAEFVPETIESALEQTYKDIEVIVVDDCSTDNSVQVVKSMLRHDNRIRLIELIPNVGLPAARNAGIAASSGEFILPLDADDKIDAKYLEKTLPLMTEGVGVVSTWMAIFGHRPEMTGHPGSGYPIIRATREQILNGNCMPVCSLIRRQTLDDVGGYPEEMRAGSEDWCLWAFIICQAKWRVQVLPEYLFYYRTRPGSMSRQATMAPFLESRERIRKFCAERYPV